MKDLQQISIRKELFTAFEEVHRVTSTGESKKTNVTAARALAEVIEDAIRAEIRRVRMLPKGKPCVASRLPLSPSEARK